MITSILAFVIAFGLLVIVHEFGHFWVARKAGVAVQVFSIGFGPKLFSLKWKETDFQVSLIPLGGYVKMLGEGDEQEIAKDDPRAFSNKSVKVRSCVVLAGPVMNLLLSFVLMPFVFWIGKPEAAYLNEPPVVERVLPASPAMSAGFRKGDHILKLEGKEALTWRSFMESMMILPEGKNLSIEVQRGGAQLFLQVETQSLPQGQGTYIGIEKFLGNAPKAVVRSVSSGSPAEKAGLQRGDQILSIHGVAITDWDDLVQQVNLFKGERQTFEVLRGEEKRSFDLEPFFDEKEKRWMIGIQGPDAEQILPLTLRKYGFVDGIKVGFWTNLNNFRLTFQVIKGLITAELSYKIMGGPVMVAYSLAKASASGISDFIYLTAFLSINLGILNLLPIPVLDGGHLLFFGLEAIRRRPISLKTRMLAQQVGMVMLLTLVVFVTWNDLKRLIGL